MKPKDIYSLNQAAKMIPISANIFYQYVKNGEINVINYQTNQCKHQGVDINEIKRIQNIINPKIDQSNINDYIQKFNMNVNTFNKYLKQTNIKPTLRHQPKKLSPRCNYYKINDLLKINQLIYQKHGQLKLNRKSKPQIVQFVINTNTIYDPKKHISINQLRILLNQKHPLSSLTIYQWIIYGHIQNYQVDLNGKIYFTQPVVKQIQNQYLKMPSDAYINNLDLANKLKIDPTQLISFRKFYEIPVYWILGAKKVYYSKENAKKLIDWWQNKDHRPYPYIKKRKK